MRFINAVQKKNYYTTKPRVDHTHHTQRATLLFKQKKNLIHTILFLNTAFSMIDKMFQQEITNAKIKQQNFIRFFLSHSVFCCCSSIKKMLMPEKYIDPENCGGNILQKLMGFDMHMDISDDDIIINKNDTNNNNNNNNDDKKYSLYMV